MLQPLLNFLDHLGRFPHRNAYGAKNLPPRSGDPVYKSEDLFKIWSPPLKSPWFPYAKATLFASVDSHQKLFQGMTQDAAASLKGQASQPSNLSWPEAGTAVLADLPQDQAIFLAHHFAEFYKFQPVALFNNWPHQKGLINCEVAAVAFATLASRMAELASGLGPESPPFFMAQSSRLGDRQPNDYDFDNRYFLCEEDLPPAVYFKQHGIFKLCYIHPARVSGSFEFKPEIETDDLNPYFCALAREGMELLEVSFDALSAAAPFQPQPRKTVLTSFSLYTQSSFRRSAAGGFGALVTPSSSGG